MTVRVENPLSWNAELAVLSANATTLVETHWRWVTENPDRSHVNNAEQSFRRRQNNALALGDKHIRIAAVTLEAWARVGKTLNLLEVINPWTEVFPHDLMREADEEASHALQILLESHPDADITLDVKHVAELVAHARKVTVRDDEPSVQTIDAALRNAEVWTEIISRRLKRFANQFQEQRWDGTWRTPRIA